MSRRGIVCDTYAGLMFLITSPSSTTLSFKKKQVLSNDTTHRPQLLFVVAGLDLESGPSIASLDSAIPTHLKFMSSQVK